MSINSIILKKCKISRTDQSVLIKLKDAFFSYFNLHFKGEGKIVSSLIIILSIISRKYFIFILLLNFEKFFFFKFRNRTLVNMCEKQLEISTEENEKNN